MPRARVDQSLYIGPFSTIQGMNVATLYKPGELGSQIQTATKAFQLVQVDSGATASAPNGVPLAGQLAYWKSRSSYIVTNDPRFAEGYRTVTGAGANSVAGVFVPLTEVAAAGTAAITPGNYGVIQQRGTHVGVSTGSNTVASGQTLRADTTSWTTTPTANANADTLGTAPAYAPIGVATAANGAVTANYTPARLGGWDIVDQP